MNKQMLKDKIKFWEEKIEQYRDAGNIIMLEFAFKERNKLQLRLEASK